MKLVLLSIFSFLCLAGCHSKKEKYSAGPLSHIKNFEVCVFFSPYEKYDRDLLFGVLIDSLKSFGSVEMIPSTFLSVPRSAATFLMVSLGGYQQENCGSIEIISPVEISVNQFKTACSIWHLSLNGSRESAVYPIDEEGKIVFKKEKQEPDVSSKVEYENHAVAILKQLIENFGKEYRNSNSDENPPIFHVYTRST